MFDPLRTQRMEQRFVSEITGYGFRILPITLDFMRAKTFKICLQIPYRPQLPDFQYFNGQDKLETQTSWIESSLKITIVFSCK